MARASGARLRPHAQPRRVFAAPRRGHGRRRRAREGALLGGGRGRAARKSLGRRAASVRRSVCSGERKRKTARLQNGRGGDVGGLAGGLRGARRRVYGRLRAKGTGGLGREKRAIQARDVLRRDGLAHVHIREEEFVRLLQRASGGLYRVRVFSHPHRRKEEPVVLADEDGDIPLGQIRRGEDGEGPISGF